MKRNKVINYEHQLNNSISFVLKEASSLFKSSGNSNIELTLKKLIQQLDELKVNYLITGGFALILYGFRRFTEDIDILITKEDLDKIHRKLIGKGYIPVFEGSRGLRDTETGVRIEFVITDEFPGDGKPKPVKFPNPVSIKPEIIQGMKVINLPTLIELKLASGMTGGYSRAHDLKDVYELIKIYKLDESFIKNLNSFVHNKYLEILKDVQTQKSQY